MFEKIKEEIDMRVDKVLLDICQQHIENNTAKSLEQTGKFVGNYLLELIPKVEANLKTNEDVLVTILTNHIQTTIKKLLDTMFEGINDYVEDPDNIARMIRG